MYSENFVNNVPVQPYQCVFYKEDGLAILTGI